jgi:DNA primase
LPDELDPDEYLLKHGVDEFDAVLRSAADALTYKWKQLVRQFNQSGNDLTGQQKAVQQYMEVLSAARGSGPVDGLRWGSAVARVSRLTGIPVDELNRLFKVKKTTAKAVVSTGEPVETQAEPGNSPTNNAPTAIQPNRRPDARDRAERWILAILLMEPHRWENVQQVVQIPDFTDPTRQKLAELYWQHQRDEGEPVFNEFLTELSGDPTLSDLATDLAMEFDTLSETDARLQDAIGHLHQMRGRIEQDKLLAELRRTTGGSDTSQPSGGDDDLLRKIQEKARTPDLRRVGS